MRGKEVTMTKEEWAKLWCEIFKDFLCVRSFITIGGFGIAYYMMFKGMTLPDLLVGIINLLLGFWFGQKVGQAVAKTNGERKPDALPPGQ